MTPSLSPRTLRLELWECFATVLVFDAGVWELWRALHLPWRVEIALAIALSVFFFILNVTCFFVSVIWDPEDFARPRVGRSSQGVWTTRRVWAPAFATSLARLFDGRPCRVFSSDLKIRVRATGLATYADAVVVCGDVAVDPEDADAVTNPALIVEVLSDSTEVYDRTEKFRHYKRIPTLRDYVLVSQHEPRVEVYSRDGARRWLYDDASTGSAPLTAIDAGIDVDRVYRDVALEPLTRRG